MPSRRQRRSSLGEPERGARDVPTSPHLQGVGTLSRASISAEDLSDSETQSLGKFHVKSSAKIRVGPDLKSKKAGDLEEGSIIDALELRTVGSVVRVRFEAGWVSMSSTKTGEMLLQPLDQLSFASHGDAEGGGGRPGTVLSGVEERDDGGSEGESSRSRSSSRSPSSDSRSSASSPTRSPGSKIPKVTRKRKGRPPQVDTLTLGNGRTARNASSPLGHCDEKQPMGDLRRSRSSEDLLCESPPRQKSPSSTTLSFRFEARKGKGGRELPLGIVWAPRAPDHTARGEMRQSRFGDDFHGEMIIVQEIKPGSLAAMQDRLTEGLVLIEMQQESLIGKSFSDFIGLQAKHGNARPLTLKFRPDEEEEEEEVPHSAQNPALTVIPFPIFASQSERLGLKFASQLDGFGDTAEHVVVIQDVSEDALTTVYNGDTFSLKPGMVLQGVSGQPVGGRTFADVMAMIYQALLVSQIESKEKQYEDLFSEEEASALIREMGRGGKMPPPPALPTATATTDGEKLIRPAPQRLYRMCNGEQVALPTSSAGAYVLEFDAVAVRSTSSKNPSGSKLTPRILKPQLSIQVTSKEPLGIKLVEVPCPERGTKVIVVGHLNYSSKATRKLEDQGLTEGMVLCAVRDIPVVTTEAGKARAGEDSDTDETPPYTLTEVEEEFKVGVRPLVLSFEGIFDEDTETSQLTPRLIDPKLAYERTIDASHVPAMQKTFDVKRGSMSKMLKLRLGDMGIQVETKKGAENGGWDSFHYSRLEKGKVQVRGRKLYIRIAASGAGARQAPVVLTCVDNQAKEIQKLVDIKIRELRAADRYEKLRAQEARSVQRAAESADGTSGIRMQQQQQLGDGSEESEPEPESEQQSSARTEMRGLPDEKREGDTTQIEVPGAGTKSADEVTNAEPASDTPFRTSSPVAPLNMKPLVLSPDVRIGEGAESPDVDAAAGTTQLQPHLHVTPRSAKLSDLAKSALAESNRHSADGSASVSSRTPPSATAATAAANGNGWGQLDAVHPQAAGRTASGPPVCADTSSNGCDWPEQELAEGVPPSPTAITSRFPAVSTAALQWATAADAKGCSRSLYEVPDFEQPRLLAAKMRLCADTVASIAARALAEPQTNSAVVAPPIVASAEAFVADVVCPVQHGMLRDLKDFVSVRGVLRQGHAGQSIEGTSADNSKFFKLGVELLVSHLIRPVAPSVEDFFDDSDDEEGHEDSNDAFDYSAPIGSRGAVKLPSDPQWPTLCLVYEFAFRFFASHDISADDAEEMLCPEETATSDDGGKGQGRRLLSQLVPLLEYTGENERASLIKLLKLLVNKFGSTRHKKVVKLLLQSTEWACVTLAYEPCGSWSSYGHGRHRGLLELLELSLTLIGKWRAPLLAYQKQFVRSLGALHNLPVERLRGCHEALKECQFTAISKAGSAGGDIAVSLLSDCLLRRWPRQSVEKQDLFLEEIEGLLPHVPPAALFTMGGQLGTILGICLRSPHSDPVLGALYVITAEDVEALFADAAAEVATERSLFAEDGGGKQVDSNERPVETIGKDVKDLAALVAAVGMDSIISNNGSAVQPEANAGVSPSAMVGREVAGLFCALQESVGVVLSTLDAAASHHNKEQRSQILELAQVASETLAGLIEDCG